MVDSQNAAGAPPGPNEAPAGDAGPEHYAVVRQLFSEHNRALVKFLMTRVRSAQEASDIAQESYVRLLQLDRPGAVGFLRGYLFRIAANLSVDRGRHQAVALRERVAVQLATTLDDVPGIDQEVMTRQEFDLAYGALEELSDNCRRAFVMRVVDGYSVAEVAQALEVDERTIRKYVTRALLLCRERLKVKVAEGGA